MWLNLFMHVLSTGGMLSMRYSHIHSAEDLGGSVASIMDTFSSDLVSGGEW
jgi:hypothetical protein